MAKRCKFCNEEKTQLGNHEKFCKLNPQRESRKSGPPKGFSPWNKGKKGVYSEETIEKMRNSSIGSLGRSKTEEGEEMRRRRISQTMKNNPNGGGYRRGSGRGVKGYYESIWCDSSWELAWIIDSIEKGIRFVRNTRKFEYFLDGNKHFYIPDFYLLEDDCYVEIKGRKSFEKLDNRGKEKILQFPYKLQVIYENEMKPILDRVIENHGKEFVQKLRKSTQVDYETSLEN